MVKLITLNVPVHVKKFFYFEYNGYCRKKRNNEEIEEIHVDRSSELGRLIYLISRPIPFPQTHPKPSGAGALSVRYYTREKLYEIPADKVELLVKQMEEIFRRTIICEVRGVHDVCGGDYGPFVAQALERRGIVRDVDIDYQTVRKMYRDYAEKIAIQNRKIFA